MDEILKTIGADEDNFPFIVGTSNGTETVMIWNVYNGMMACHIEDGIVNNQIIHYLKDNAYPVFRSLNDANQYAIKHNWPKKTRW